MATLYTHQSSNIAKTWLLMTIFFGIVIAVGYGVSWYLGNVYILYGFVIFAVAMNVYSYWFSDTLVVKMTGAQQADVAQYRKLHNMVENLAITAGLPKPKVYIVNDPAPNAFATGRDPQHAVVAVTTGILGLLEDNELEGVLAHELSHVGNRDMLVATVAVVLVGFVAIVADFIQHTLLWGGGDREGKNGVVVLVVAIAIAILAPLAATLMQLAVSRKREFLADASGALLTRYPEGLASALQKISSYSGGMKKHSSATAHLFIANPLGGTNEREKKKTPFLRKIFSTHPPVEERVAALLGQRV